VTAAPLDVQTHIGVLSDSQGLYPRLTARENIRYFGQLHDMQGEALEKQMERLIGLLDMASIADRRTEGFSTGERLKVAIARALVHDPRTVLLDEPTNGLMKKYAPCVSSFYICRCGKCILFTSHTVQEVAALVTRP
jgi:sodium transport system ATP-binding protein